MGGDGKIRMLYFFCLRAAGICEARICAGKLWTRRPLRAEGGAAEAGGVQCFGMASEN